MDEYSTKGRTRVLYAVSRMAGFFVLVLRLRKPSDLFAEVVILWMSVLKVVTDFHA